MQVNDYDDRTFESLPTITQAMIAAAIALVVVAIMTAIAIGHFA